MQPLGKGVFSFDNGLVQEGEFVVDESGEKGEEETPALKTKWAGAAIAAL